jgi:polysaccharide export outer membrane protein
VLQLIAEAGGLGVYANRKGIFILRVVENTTTKIPFNYNNVIHGNSKQNINLQPGDTVFVP